MTSSRLVLTALLFAASAASAQEPATLLVSPDARGVALRWAWAEGARPAGYFVERRAADEAAWTRLTPQPITRSRDRGLARTRLGAQWSRYGGLLFPEDPRAERADPESFRALLLLAADVEPAVAELLGLRYDDDAARPGGAFAYRLVALTARGEVAGPASSVVVAGSHTPAAAPDSLRAAPSKTGVALRWKVATAFTAYDVYRATRRDGNDWARLNGAPVVVFYDERSHTESAPTFFSDAAVPPADSVFYRVEGIDAFGRRSRRSEPVSIAWRDPAAPAPPPTLQARVRGDTVALTWIAPPAATAVSWQVWRADNSTGPFTRLGAPVAAPTLGYLHAGQPSRHLLWYRITAIDGSGREGDPSPLALAEVPDLEAPPSPATPLGTADTGRLRVDWPRVGSTDLLGYRVYRSFAPDGGFGMLTPAPNRDTSFTDTIPAAADHPFYYRVTAVDSAFNESAPSAAIAVRPPDVTPPSAPRVTGLRRGVLALTLEWLPNPEPDVVAYRVLFREAGSPAWQELPAAVLSAGRSATIAQLSAGRRYEVSLVADDDAGNHSPAAPARVAEPAGGAAAAPDLRRASWERRDRAVVLEWAAIADDVVELLILRREEAGAFRPVGVAQPGETRFADATARPSRRYEYTLQARNRGGALAESRPRRVVVPGAGR